MVGKSSATGTMNEGCRTNHLALNNHSPKPHSSGLEHGERTAVMTFLLGRSPGNETLPGDPPSTSSGSGGGDIQSRSCQQGTLQCRIRAKPTLST